jgi:glycine oxidase
VARSTRRVVVIGAGVVGCATAYELARAGLTVILIERDQVAAHASGCNAGNLNPLQGTPPELLPWALRAFRLHAQIRGELQELGCRPAHIEPVGRIYLGWEAADLPALQEIAALFSSTEGFSSQWLEPCQLHQLEPRLAQPLRCGVLTRGNLTVEGRELTQALCEGALRLGGSLHMTEVVGVQTRGDTVTGIRTPQGTINCHEVVLATGPWTGGARAWLGIDIPVEPAKGEMLLMHMPTGAPRYDLTWNQTSLYRRRGGQVWVGTTLERCGLDTTTSAQAQQSLLASAVRMMPAIEQGELLEQVAALRPMSLSGLPIAARAPGWQNVYIANGGGPKGLLLSVGIARAIRDLLLEDARATSVY